jgi:DNA-binding NtrC family response regulator
MSATTASADVTAPRPIVLLADDDPDRRQMVAAYLEHEGFTVAQAGNGLDALLQLERVRPTSVVLNLTMPLVDGDALKRITAFDPAMTVVVIAGSADPELQRYALALGATAVLTKPVALDDLRSVLVGRSHVVDGVVDIQRTVSALAATGSGPVKRVLVVDDEEEIRALLEEFLTAAGYQTRSAADGALALCAIVEEAPDLVLLDIDLPRLGGLKALATIQAIAPEVKVIMISGKGSLEVAKQTLASGAFDYVAKPFDMDYLREAVAAAFLV